MVIQFLIMVIAGEINKRQFMNVPTAAYLGSTAV